MKRSEMIKSIIAPIIAGKELNKLNYLECAEQVLSAIEISGMRYVNENYCMCGECDGNEYTFGFENE